MIMLSTIAGDRLLGSSQQAIVCMDVTRSIVCLTRLPERAAGALPCAENSILCGRLGSS